VALSALGFDTRGSDGVFGPRSRDMIAAWQKARNQPATGYLTGAQNQALLKEAAPAIARYDDEQRKLEEEKKKADEAAKAQAAAAPPAVSPAPAAAPVAAAGPFDGAFGGGATINVPGGPNMQTAKIASIAVQVAGTRLTGQGATVCGNFAIDLAVSASGSISGSVRIPDVLQCSSPMPATVSGQVKGNDLDITMRAPNFNVTGTLKKGAAAPAIYSGAAPAAAPASPASAASPFDGTYTGGATASPTSGQISGNRGPSTSSWSVYVKGSALVGQGTFANCGSFTIGLPVSSTGDIVGDVLWPDAAQCTPAKASFRGKVSGASLQFEVNGLGFKVLGMLNKGASSGNLNRDPNQTQNNPR